MCPSLDLDDASPGQTMAEVCDLALSDSARRQRISEIGELEGRFPWEGNLDDLRLREPYPLSPA
jgi:hypothetical protein